MPAFRENHVYAGRYQLEELIGEGGFSEVWRARDAMADDAIVALKIYAPEKGLDEYGIRQFRKEYSIAFGLSHPHLMRIFHFDICNGSPYLIMPYFPLGSVSHYLHDNPALSERQVACFLYQIGGALAELHAQQPPILHHDIKPDNILVRNKEYFVLTDFGISYKTRHTLTKATGSLNSLTVAYSPPERFDRTPVSTEASDIFSLGVSLYEMCTGVVPWDGHGGQSLHIGARIPDLPRNFSRELNRVLRACMAVAPEERPTAEHLKNLAGHFLDKGNWKFVERKKRSSFMLSGAIVFLVVFGIAFASYRLIFWKPQPIPTAQPEVETTDTTVVPPAIEKQPERSVVPLVPQLSDSVAGQALGESNHSTTDTASPAKDPLPVERKRNGYKVPRKLSVDSVQYYLNTLSDQAIARSKRSELKRNVLSLFVSNEAKIFERNGTTSFIHLANNYLNLLMDSVHYIEVMDLTEDENRKIVELQIQVSK